MVNIFQRMAAITNDVPTVAKNLNVGFGKNSYKGVGEGDVIAAIRPLEQKYGVYSYPFNREIVWAEMLETEKEYNGNTQTKVSFVMRIKTTYRFVNVDDPKEYIDMVSYGDGTDPMDKSPGKAMTYSDKYALLKAYKIVTGDDPDQFHSDETKVKARYHAPSDRGADRQAAQARGEEERTNALQTILKRLDQPDNAPFKMTVIEELTTKHGVSSWMDIPIDADHPYTELIADVSAIIKREKAIKQKGL